MNDAKVTPELIRFVKNWVKDGYMHDGWGHPPDSYWKSPVVRPPTAP